MHRCRPIRSALHHWTLHPRSGAPLLLASALVILFCSGCPQYADPTAPNRINSIREPSLGRDYLIYTPTRYDATQPTALVIVCHGTSPWDTARRQIRDWVKLAEEKNFIVAAPTLAGTRGDFPPPAARQVELQRRDEETILAVLQHIRGGHNIREDAVFLTGWSAGNFAVLYTGLKHPDVFRALAVLQGNFNSAYLSAVADTVDPFQPVYVLYGSMDLLAEQGRACVQWLYDRNAYVVENEVPGAHRAYPHEAFEFFQRMMRESPWLCLLPFGAGSDQPLTVEFRIRASFEPAAYEWSFGDGESSPVARPVHAYAKPGEYRVTLTAAMPNAKRLRRSIDVQVPQQRLPHPLLR